MGLLKNKFYANDSKDKIVNLTKALKYVCKKGNIINLTNI